MKKKVYEIIGNSQQDQCVNSYDVVKVLNYLKKRSRFECHTNWREAVYRLVPASKSRQTTIMSK